MIPPALCINLTRRPDRWEQAQAEFITCGIDACRMPAFDGPEEYPRSRGPMGCMRSHRFIWRMLAMGWAGVSSIAIFEDDFQLLTEGDLIAAGYTDESPTLKSFRSIPGASFQERFAAVEPEIPLDFDLLYLGGGYARGPLERISRHIIRNTGMLCTHAYIISRTFAARLTADLDASHPLDNVHREYPGAADSVLAEYARRDDVKSYTLQPRLFIQRPGTRSDITGEVPNFPHHLVDSAHEGMV